MKFALAQLNPTVGDLRGNVAKIAQATHQAASEGAQLVAVSELAVSGYPPKDLLLRDGFVERCERAVDHLATLIPQHVGLLVGHPSRVPDETERSANAVSLLHQGRIQATRHKRLLPNYDVFDERRYFRPAERVEPIEFAGRRLGVHICEDAWWHDPGTWHRHEPQGFPDPVAELAAAGVDLFVNLSASPFEIHKPARRRELMRQQAVRHARPFIFVNQHGGNDDLVFDGNSFALDARGNAVALGRAFADDLQIVDLDRMGRPLLIEETPPAGQRLDALIAGLRDYARKSGFTDCVLGLSGGIDSAIAAYIAAEAVGPKHVHGLLMPSRYSSEHSVADAQHLAERLGISAEVVPIDAVHRAYESIVGPGDVIRGDAAGLAAQNLQARIRGALVMIRSNAHGWLPLATGNKSELAMGYCTLYGDMAGGFAVLADVLKRDVYAMARYVNERRARREVIPQNTIDKAPSAELAPNQFDQDTLPPYPVLDAILEGLIEREESTAALSRRFPLETVRWVASRLDRNEYKRRQMPPGIKLTARSFGVGRRMPIAARFDEEFA